MLIQRKAFVAGTETLSDKRQVRVICSTSAIDRSGDIVVQEGIDLTSYRANPVVLLDHNYSQRVARCVEIGIEGGNLTALVEFPPEGELPLSDRTRLEVKHGLLNAVSIGFMVIESEPMDKSKPKGPQKIIRCDLAEFSFVGVPANPGALVVERSMKDGTNWKVGASQSLPVEDAVWDAEKAAESIFAKAGFGGDSPDTTFARKGFLAYDAANPLDRKSYRVPFAMVGDDGRLKAVAAGLKAAGEAFPITDVPEGVETKARDLVASYAGKADAPAPVKKSAPVTAIKSLYDVGTLARVLMDLGWVRECAEWEAEYEGDNSAVPQMIADAMRAVADALLAMTAEEVAELLADIAEDADEAVEKRLVSKSAHPFAKAVAALKIKEGRSFSGANVDAIMTACSSIKAGHDTITSLVSPAPDEGEDMTDKAAEADMAKAAAIRAREKRLREVELLRRRIGA